MGRLGQGDRKGDTFAATFSASLGIVPQLKALGDMKLLLITIIAAVVLVGCGPSNTEDALLHAAFDENIEAAKQAIAAGADVNAKREGGWTLLHDLAHQGKKEIIELLITEGVDVNAKDNDDDTPLDWAIKDNHTEIVNLLRKHGGKTAAELKGK